MNNECSPESSNCKDGLAYILTLMGEGVWTQKDIVKITGKHKSTISRNMKALEKQGRVKKCSNTYVVALRFPEGGNTQHNKYVV